MKEEDGNPTAEGRRRRQKVNELRGQAGDHKEPNIPH